MKSESNLDLSKKIAVIGLGRSGLSAMALLQKLGANRLTTLDESGEADYSDGKSLLTDFQPDVLVVSPGVPLSKDWIQEFSQKGGCLTSELNIASSCLDGEKVLGITGSMGKSTVCAALSFALEKEGKGVFLGGNFGVPLAQYCLDTLENRRGRAEFIVLELSSFQLENCVQLKLDYAGITALAPNHLERYSSCEDYYDTKWSIQNQSRGRILLNACNAELKAYVAKKDDSSGFEWINENFEDDWLDAKIVGTHNHENLGYSFGVLQRVGEFQNAKSDLQDFPGLSHRLENLGERKGRLFINDSKATNIDSVKAAIDSCANLNRPIVLLLGGKDKGLPWEELLPFRSKLKSILAFGEMAQRLVNIFGKDCVSFPSLKSLMLAIALNSEAGDLVLLSPGGTSFDEFRSFEERGERFSEWVKNV